MNYTVNQLAALSGVTPRTLRWYDSIGLLCPHRAKNGYRYYGKSEVDRLQQVLFYRACGLGLEQIAAALDAPDFDATQALQQHIAHLHCQRSELDTLIANAQKTLLHIKGETAMKDKEQFEGFKKKLVDDNEKQYGEEVRQRWGDEAANAANAKMMNMTQQQYSAFLQLQEELHQTLATAMKDGRPDSELGQKAAALHKDWLCYTWSEYSAEAHRNLTQMYVDDERFTQYYEKIAPGAAAFLRDAVHIFTA